MEGPDVIIFYGNDASEWNSYLMRCFQDQTTSCGSGADHHHQHHNQQRPLSVRHICISNLKLPSTMDVMSFYRRAKVQIVILSPEFLDVVLQLDSASAIDLFEPARVLALMCGVVESEVTADHRERFAGYSTWKKMTVVENDNAFVVDLIGAALQLVTQAQTQTHTQVTAPTVSQTHSKAFRLFPSKARESNPLVWIHLTKPLRDGQVVSVEFETEDKNIPIEVKCANPYCVSFVVPDHFFQGFVCFVNVNVKSNSESLGVRPLKCESKMGELNRLLNNILDPVEFMCQTLGLSSTRIEHLDRVLVKNLRKNLPKAAFSIFTFDDNVSQSESCKLPTVLHFAAKNGLREVCAALLDCPGAAAACRIRNSDGLGPIELADSHGHTSLANMIDDFMKLSETEQVYRYMKSVAQGDSDVDYENLRTVFVQSVANAGYFMDAFVDGDANDDAVQPTELTNGMQKSRPNSETLDGPKVALESDLDKALAATAVEGLTPFSQSQRELIQMMEDVKRDKATIEETLELFSNWKQRQKVHSSFKEKQAQLLSMRQRYEVMQKKCQQEGKKSVIERFRTLLARSPRSSAETPVDSKTIAVHVRSKSHVPSNEDHQSLMGDSNAARPCSHSSCSSSGSSRCSSSLSNRSSTLSALSVSSAADSGTQSDIGEEPSVIQVVQHSGSPRQLTKSVLPKRVVHNPWKSPPHHCATRPLPSLPPDKCLPTSAASLATVPFSSSCRRRNPMPVPRVTTSSTSSHPFVRKTPSASGSIPPSPDYITPEADADAVTNDGCTPNSLRQRQQQQQQQRPSTTSSDNPQPMLSSSPFGDGYLPMDVAAAAAAVGGTLSHTSPRRKKSSSSGPRSPNDRSRLSRDDLDYCNVVYAHNSSGHEHYMDMNLNLNLQQVNADYDGTANSLVRPPLPPLPQVGTGKATFSPRSHVYINTSLAGLAVDCDFSDRCDSVPEMPPPAPPASTLSRSRHVVPPPLPPRNPQIISRAK